LRHNQLHYLTFQASRESGSSTLANM